ncbi:MAG: hypothetical protein WC679_11980 [Bacteroidales bacterium]
MKQFTDGLLDKISVELTDIVFQYIENDKELLKQYLDLVANTGNLKVVNSNIAKAVSKRFDLKTNGKQEINPKSKLIQSYSDMSTLEGVIKSMEENLEDLKRKLEESYNNNDESNAEQLLEQQRLNKRIKKLQEDIKKKKEDLKKK